MARNQKLYHGVCSVCGKEKLLMRAGKHEGRKPWCDRCYRGDHARKICFICHTVKLGLDTLTQTMCWRCKRARSASTQGYTNRPMMDIRERNVALYESRAAAGVDIFTGEPVTEEAAA